MKNVTSRDMATQEARRLLVSPRIWSERRRKCEVGQSLIEFALMLPFLMLLSIGIVELGRAAYVSIVVTNGATAGVEYGSQSVTTASDISGMQNAVTKDVAQNSIGGTMSSTATYGCYCDDGSGISCTYISAGQDCTGGNVTTCSCGTIQASCTGQIVECVQVDNHVDFTPLFHWPGLPPAYQSNGHSVMRVRH
jgi:Flp pilus assembly protein TadG